MLTRNKTVIQALIFINFQPELLRRANLDYNDGKLTIADLLNSLVGNFVSFGKIFIQNYFMAMHVI